jgi:Carboxypeptidase regulatory-like domain
MKRASKVAFLLVFLSSLVFTSQFAFGDNLYASIRGTVVDPSGAVVPDAKLTATNLATGLTYNATSSKDGLFAFLQLPIGDYSVRVEKSGFKAVTEGHIHLDLDQIYNLRVSLELGTTSETITVEANPAQVETTSMQLGTTITGSQIVDLPLNGRNWTQLMQLQPGVQAGSDRFGTTGTLGGYSTNGAETQQNSFLINGTDSNDTSLNTPLVIPSPDAIGEFDLVSSTINPEYGRNSGAIVNAAIKSGTNQFHGDVFEFYRDTFLDAIPWFASTNLQGQPVNPLFHQNQFGGTIGGPIVKDHAFFFFSYQGRRATTPQLGALSSTYNAFFFGQSGAPSVFSQAQRGGDFSSSPSFYGPGNPEPATSPCGANYTGPFGPNPLPSAVGSAAAGTPWCVAFPTGTIPTADLNPLSVKLMNQYVPLPTPGAPSNEYLFTPLELDKRDQYLGRIDEKLTNKDAIWFYGLYENDSSGQGLPFVGASLPGFNDNNPQTFDEFTLAWNHTISATTLNEARVAYLRTNYQAVIPAQTQSPSAYGFNGITANQDPAASQLPVMAVVGLFGLGFSADGPQPRYQNTYQVVDNFSKVIGHHTMKFGFNMDRLEINNPFYSNLNGLYQFLGGGPFSTNNPGADFLLGLPTSYEQGSGSIIRARGREYYSYGQDQWQMRPNLTLTLGLGWDIETPFKNLYANGLVLDSFHPGQQSTVFPTAPVGLVFPGDSGVNEYGGATVHYTDFAPRLGFAWSPGGSHNWSIRGGIGLYYNRSEEEATLQTLTNVPFSDTSAGGGINGASPGFANPYVSVNPGTVNGVGPQSATNPFPFSPPGRGASISTACTPGSTALCWPQFEPIGFNDVFYDPRLTVPRSTNFNLTVQRQIDKATVATLGYVGTIGRHLEGAYNMNPAGTATGDPAAAAVLGTTGADLDYSLGPSVCPASLSTSIGFGNGACVPGTFQYNANVYGETGVFATNWNSNYNSLQASINRHFSQGLQFQAAYTWSRYFDYTSNLENSAFDYPGFNALDFGRNYGPSANDDPQRLVLNYIYTLPFYRFTHRWRSLTDDWNLSGIGTFQHGFPVAVFQTSFNDLQFSGNQSFFAAPAFVNDTGAPLDINHNPRSSATQQWVNPAAFSVPAAGTQGTANRNPFYGPGLNYWDMALEKGVRFTETMKLELRFETFDSFNHANFANPNNSLSPVFGQVASVQAISTLGVGRVVQLGAKIYF